MGGVPFLAMDLPIAIHMLEAVRNLYLLVDPLSEACKSAHLGCSIAYGLSAPLVSRVPAVVRSTFQLVSAFGFHNRV